MQKVINIALVVLKIFKVIKSTTFPTKFDRNVNGVEGKIGCAHPANFRG